MEIRRIALAAMIAAAPVWLRGAEAFAADCAADSTAAGLDAFFSGDDAAGLAGADYPHVIDLPDGRRLWYFQDVFFGTGGRLGSDRFAHNAALIQDGDCFEVLPPPGGKGESWIGSWVERDLNNWIWPLDAAVGADGDLRLFLAEMQNPNGVGAARGARPIGTWIARYTLPDLRLIGMEEAPDPSRSLFGYSIVSDDEWSYLYGHCYRQFDEAGTIGFDPSCSPHAFLARVPVGEFERELEYWTDDAWSSDRAGRTPVLTANQSMPVSVQRFGDTYVAASDENDWFGADVVVYTARAPQGPWTEALRYTPDTRCGDDCNNYGAFVLPELEGDRVVIAQSNNAWDMRDAFTDAALYRIGLRAVDVPGVTAANLDRSPDLALADEEPESTPGASTPDTTPATERASGETPVVPEQELPAAEMIDELLSTEDAPLWRSTLGAIGLGAALALVVALVFAAILSQAVTARRTRRRRRRAVERMRHPSARRTHATPPVDVSPG